MFLSLIMQHWNISIDLWNFISFVKWMCPTKMLLRPFLTLTMHKWLFVFTQQTVKFFHNLLCSWIPWVLLSQPQLVKNNFFWCHYLKNNKMIWCNLLELPINFETSKPWIYIFSILENGNDFFKLLWGQGWFVLSSNVCFLYLHGKNFGIPYTYCNKCVCKLMMQRP